MLIGAYEVETTVGQGGMGVVYGARSPDGRAVAVKVLLKKDGDAVARFARERRLLGSLGVREGFVPLLDAGDTPAGPYVVMPLVPGGTLRRRLVAGPLGVDETAALGRKLAAALGAAHARGIVHRDVKPENVLFTAEGVPLLADLGLAKHFDPLGPGASQSVSLSANGDFRGTAGYMAPEQMVSTKEVGPEADVYALGVILYECLAGEPPFLGKTLVDLLQRVTVGTFEPIERRRPEAPAWLAAAIDRALDVSPARRFADGRAFHAALEAPSRRRSRAAVLALALLVPATGAGVFAASRPGKTRPASAPAAPIAPRAEPPPPRRAAKDWLASGREKVEKKDWDGAIADLTKAIDANPARASAWAERSRAQSGKGDPAAAVADAERAVALEPRSAEAWTAHGLARDLDQRPEAITDFTRAIDLDPRFLRAWYNRGVYRDALADHDGAIEDLTRAIRIDPLFAQAWGARANAHMHKGDARPCQRDSSRAIELDPKVAWFWTARAVVTLALGDAPGAIPDFTEAIRLTPDDGLAWSRRAGAYAAIGDWDADIADCTKALECGPRSALVFAERGAARGKKSDWAGAIADTTQAIDLDANLAISYANRGFARENTGEVPGAIADYEWFLHLEQDPAATAPIRARLEALRQKSK
jgi:tetratricopeptide (TPR) repeat protein